MADITSITFHHKYNYVNFSDSDCMSDYFHGASLGQKETVKWISESGADIIGTHTTNEDKEIPTLRRVKQICKGSGYAYIDKSHLHSYNGWGSPYEAWTIRYLLVKKELLKSYCEAEIEKELLNIAYRASFWQRSIFPTNSKKEMVKSARFINNMQEALKF